MKYKFLNIFTQKHTKQTHKEISSKNDSQNKDFNKQITQTSHSIYDNPNYMNIFMNISSKQNLLTSKYLDMAYVAANIKDSIVLSVPLKTWSASKNADELNKKFEQDIQFTQIHFQDNIKMSHKLDHRVTLRETLFKNIREVYPSFGLNMENKISKKDYEIYKKVKKRFTSLLLNRVEYHQNIDQSEALLQKQDLFSDIIDTPWFSKACEIQDNFLISEIDNFLKQLELLPPEEKKKFTKANILLNSGKKTSTIILAKLTKQKISKRLEEYIHITELYKKMKLSPYDYLDSENKDDLENSSITLSEHE